MTTNSVSEDSPKNHYELLGVKPTASPQEIRRAYRELSKLYHPDTTELSSAIATKKFQALNEAYGTLSNPEQRLSYDSKIGYSRFYVSQAPKDIRTGSGKDSPFESRYTYLDPTDRPLSAGEIFALFILGLTFAVCLALVFILGIADSDFTLSVLQP
ncbi:J domain-containing protein [Leptolyngbyaceae cyanobacterium CCMR0082]|uniref:J domain-containing protein n=1 Tax=Adonisia turfae CCMR0082 TaxID=2304604 RepID=A0A6M0S5M4_9CYAN|nr:J domain-containing protein [Adonisia turfae]NEZ63767.1 J domain-containing protein [Adonisia turfae CCMR0082]